MEQLILPKKNFHIVRKRSLSHEFKFEHCRNGKPIWDQDWTPNQLVDEGESAMLDVFYRAGTAPTFHLSLWNDTPIDTDTMASGLTGEVTGTGYARIPLLRNTTDWPTLALDAGDFRVSSLQKTFTAGAAWSPATALLLVAPLTSTGTFYAWAPLAATRTLAASDTLNVIIRVKLG